MKPTFLILILFSFTSTGCSGESETSVEPVSPASVSQAKKPIVPLIQRAEIIDWCKEHGVPESICSRCDISLVTRFKAENDWCVAHDLPESQCFECSPELEAKFEALAPKK
jgi:hypothetical protein